MNNKFSQLGLLAAGIHFMGSPLVSMNLQTQANNEKLITEISILTGRTSKEITAYWNISSYDLETIKAIAAKTGKLSE